MKVTLNSDFAETITHNKTFCKLRKYVFCSYLMQINQHSVNTPGNDRNKIKQKNIVDNG